MTDMTRVQAGRIRRPALSSAAGGILTTEPTPDMPRLLSSLVVLFAMPSLARGQDTGTATDEDAVPNTKELHRGIIPLRDYSGDLGERSNLLGDWGGLRRDLAEKGILFRGWLTPLLQSVADGGASTDTEFGASMDFWAAVDFDRRFV